MVDKQGSDFGGSVVTNEEFQAQMFTVKTAIEQLMQANSIENAIGNGMANLAKMLEPLRTLQASRGPLDPNPAAALEAIHVSLARPSYDNLETEGLDNFIAVNTGKTRGRKS